MNKLLLAAVGTCVALTGVSSAQAADGCGPGGHRGYYGHCRPNRGPVFVARGGPEVGGYRDGRGYWDGHRYWHHRERWHGGWRYR